MKTSFLAALATSLALSLGANASTIEWANAGTSWPTGADWVGGNAPANSLVTDIAAFGSQGAAAVSPVLTSARSINGISFLSGAYNYTISGSILNIGSGGISSGAIFATETISSTVRLSITQNWNSAGTLNINGTLDFNNNSATARTLTIQGGGVTNLNGVVQSSFMGSTGSLIYAGVGNGSLFLANANTYNGGTTISSGVLHGTHDGAFGLGDVSLTSNTSQVFLASGITNDYINNSATLSLSNGATMFLSYAGTDIVASFVVNGIAQPAGVYSMANEPGVLSGTGTITVLPVPEPTTYVSVLGGLALLIGAQWLRRRRA
ncbi:MAG: PEP-CTERM sorting domain-containing protein [Chthoniobacterales bacterium]